MCQARYSKINVEDMTVKVAFPYHLIVVSLHLEVAY